MLPTQDKKTLDDYHLLISENRLNEAEIYLHEILKQDPNRADVLFELGNISQRQLAHLAAVEYYQRALDANPKHLQARLFLSGSLQELGQFEEATQQIKKALEQDPENALAHHALGVNYQFFGNLDAARESYQAAIKLDPNLGQSHNNLGIILGAQGRIEEALRHIDTAIRLNPKDFEAIYNRASLTKHTKVDRKLKKIEKRFSSKSTGDHEKTHLGFALAKAYDDIGNYDKAARFYVEANNSQRALQPYDIEIALKHFRAVEEAFQSDPLRNLALPPRDGVTPIFILGMPRSGSSLLEHILASHSQVAAGGEMETLRKSISGTLPFHDRSAAAASASELTTVANEYIDHITAIADGRSRFVTDKMPSNFEFLGLIHAAMPHSKIIRTDRNPLDTCLSCYQQKFSSQRQSFSNDLRDLGRYYLACQALLDFWESMYPDWVITVRYEDITSRTESTIRNLLQSLGLEFESSCLEHHLNRDHSVYTASQLQVRDKIHSRSVEKWRNYDKMLAPLKSQIGMA